jgi:hypothetical protein
MDCELFHYQTTLNFEIITEEELRYSKVQSSTEKFNGNFKILSIDFEISGFEISGLDVITTSII